MKQFREKLCLILSLVCIGCGREMTTKESDSERSVEPVTPSSLQLTASKSKNDVLYVNGEFTATQELLVRPDDVISVSEGSTGDGTATLVFNSNAVNEKVVCSYNSDAVNNQYLLAACSGNSPVIVKKNSKIQLMANAGDNNTKKLIIHSQIHAENSQIQIHLKAEKHLAHFTAITGSTVFQADGRVSIPEFIKVKKGNAGNQKAYVYYNFYRDTFQFYCTYHGGASSQFPETPEEVEKGTYYYFHACFDKDDQDINALPGEKILQHKNKFLVLKIDNSDTRYDTEVFADFELDWF